jgi:hypothetical protein
MFNVYPNPVKEMISIELEIIENAEYQVLNTAGKVFLSGNIYNGSISVDVNNLATGLYVIKVSGESTWQIKKIIIK